LNVVGGNIKVVNRDKVITVRLLILAGRIRQKSVVRALNQWQMMKRTAMTVLMSQVLIGVASFGGRLEQRALLLASWQRTPNLHPCWERERHEAQAFAASRENSAARSGQIQTPRDPLSWFRFLVEGLIVAIVLCVLGPEQQRRGIFCLLPVFVAVLASVASVQSRHC
jgi:hypothetical protein